MNKVIAACLLLLAGCGDKKNPFPIGLYDVTDPALIQKVKDAGFDHILSSASGEQAAAVAKEARRRGLQVITATGPSQDNVPGGVAQAFILGWYPVPQLPIESVAEKLDAAQAGGKPLWFGVQAFDWKDYKRPKGRFPDHAEIRFMSWQAILHGAKGLFFSRLDRPDGGTLFDYPELWQAVERVSRELKGFQPILEGGTLCHLPFPPINFSVEARSWRYHGRTYVALLNAHPDLYQKIPEEMLKARWRPLFAPRRDVKDLLKALNGGWYVKPYQVLVFEGPMFSRP